jgi:multidrug resistance efflux pump
MPSLIRFLSVLAVIAGLIYGAMWALVTFVEPQQRDVTIRIPSERVNPPSTGTINTTKK